MNPQNPIPTWSELFGSPDTKEADAGRSLTSPAAYLADLLQLLESRFDPSDFRSRRPDIGAQILLNGDQSFTLVRQLDITNRVLGDRIASLNDKKPADEVLAGAQQPFLLPFEHQHERIRQLLLLLRTTYRDLYSSFAPNNDVDVLARERLGLSPLRAATIVQDRSGDAAGLRTVYGLASDEALSSLADLDRFGRATQLDGPSLRQLLFSHLSQSSSNVGGAPEREAAGLLYINHDLGGYVTLDAAEQRLIWSDKSKAIPDAWFDRVHRLLCLSRWTGIDLPSLDLALRQLCQNTLDQKALRRLAVLLDLCERTGATIEVLCSLVGDLDGLAALGAGDDPKQPASLFDRTFNGEAARLADRYVPSGSGYLPQAYVGWQKLVATGDLLSDLGDNKDLRFRIQKLLGISAQDLSAVVTRFRDRATSRGRVSRLASIDSGGLSTLYRVARLADLVNLAPLELLLFVDVLENDPNLKVLNAFDVLYHEDIAQADLYEVLEQGSVEARSWLIQNLIAIAAWAAAAGLAPEDLEAAAVVPGPTDPKQQAELLTTAQALHDAFLPTALSADALQSAGISDHMARVALAIFREPARRLVSPSDASLVTWDKQQARKAACAALAALDVVSANDIEALSLGEGLATYLQSLLIRRGVLDAKGMLSEEQLPARAEDLVLEPDESAQFGQIFDFLNGLYTTALAESVAANPQADGSNDSGAADGNADLQADGSNGSGAADGAADLQADGMNGSGAAAAGSDVEVQLFPSDLLKLGFDLSEADEWIERLTFLRILDASGSVQNPSLFADPANIDTIPISLGLDSFRAEIHAQLASLINKWLCAPLTLPVDIWDGLKLTPDESGALEQNLVFNGYIDAARRIVDRKVLEALTPDSFDLALPFYRKSRAILDALQGVISSSRDQYLTVGPDQLRSLADRFIAFDVHEKLSTNYLDPSGRLNSEVLAQIASGQPAIDLGPVYSGPQQQLIWSLLQQINTEASTFRLTDAALATINITGDNASDVVVSLCADGCLNPDRSLAADQVKRFAVVKSAQNFTLPAYADYARDVFFLLHDVAVAVDAAVKSLMTALQAVAGAQETAVLAAIASQFGLSPDAASAIVRPLVRDEPNLTAALVAPVLRAAGTQDTLPEPPRDRTFSVTLGRTAAFANFATKLSMSPREIQAAFKDQQLVDKFPEGIILPQGADGIDALWTGPGGPIASSSTFSPSDLVNLALLTGKLAQPARPIDTWLAGQLSVATNVFLESYEGQGSDVTSLQAALVQDLNRLLLGPSIYDTRRFSGVVLRAKVQTLVSGGLEGSDLPGVNRLLLEDAYPLELARNQLYLFRGPRYWTFDASTLETNEGPLPLETLCAEFKGLAAVDAVYTLPTGEHWLLAEGQAWRLAPDGDRWVKAVGETARPWGQIQSRFDDRARIDGALVDSEGVIYLFSGDQYVRYSNWPQDFVDEGYPKGVAAQWPKELGFGPLPSGWDSGIDSAVERKDEVTWLFKEDHYVASTAPGVECNIVDSWGNVRNNLASASGVDAVLDVGGRCGVVAGDQVSVFSNSLESEGLTADEGFPRTLAAVFQGLSDPFVHAVDAGLTDENGTIHLFRDQNCATGKDGKWESHPTRDRWGRVKNTLQETGRVDAALSGLDGKIYIFSGDQYVRFSSSDLSRADEGYPRSISRDWGGLASVDAAFVLDGKTYVFGPDHHSYVCYSTRDYTKPDAGYPQETSDNWWNLPVALLNLGFKTPDSVFVAADRRVHLFKDHQTISFDHNHRWWSEPVPIRDVFHSLPFATVSAGFVGRDGRAYLFSTDGEPSFVRYSDHTFNRVDDRFPKPVKEQWGKVVNNVERTGRVDAAVTLVSTVTGKDASGKESNKPVRYRYLFSGDQFYRYSSDEQPFVDEGYPLRIQNNLRREPHFAHLDAPTDRGVDGVWADKGNVFVFISDRIYVASVANDRELDGLGVDEPRSADVEEGRLTIFGKDGWRQILPPEAQARAAVPALPRVLRRAPSAFQGKLSAILRGLDNNVYLFSDLQCYDVALEHQYPTGEAWGRVQNRIADDELVDCALWGRDGKLYLFRGDQFVSYTPSKDAPTKIPDLADANPSPVAARWGGLSNVRHAFVQKGVTYLLEAPAEDGSFRYVRYFGTDYSRPNDPVPLFGDVSFWKIPDEYMESGPDAVDAVLSEGHDLILIRGTKFLLHDGAKDTWTYPRPLSLRWPGLSRRYPDFETIHAVVRGPDGKTYFFADGSWLSHDGERPSELATISSRWAVVSNRIARLNRVDATLVHGDQTFLFSGDEYVRYTGSNYQYVDVGYPRPIAGLLRQEAPFQQLPTDIESAFGKLKPEDVWIATAFCTGGVICVSLAGKNYALSAQLSRSYPVQQVAQVRNELLRRARVDAAFARADGTLFLLSGDQYVRYSQLELDVVDDGYPRAIGDSLLRELVGDGAPTLPLEFQHHLDASIYDKKGTLVLFKGQHFVRMDPSAKGGQLSPMEIKGTWGRVSNPFLASQADPQPRIDAAFLAPDNSLYVFKGDQFLRYTDPTAVFVDEGYPRAIRDLWGDLPDEFKKGINGAFVLGGRTYLCRDPRIVRYRDPSYRRMDPTYPQLFTNRWRASNDFLLGDLRTIQRYVALDQGHPSDDASLTDFLLGSPRDNVDPYALLATLFNWEVGDVQWLKRRDAFLDRPNRDLADETRFDIPQVLRIYSTLELARRLGSHPQELYEQVWSPLYGADRNPTIAADTLNRLLGTLYPGDDWTKIQRQLGDALSRLRRDALVAWLLAHSPQKFDDDRSLSEFLLTDVEIDAIVDTSPIVEATAAIQLYFYRYLMNLEPALATGDDATRRSQFKAQWQWLKNYRVWEANRQVFLYPESYIRPELRASRTEAFRSLQSNLQQGAITADSVTQAYKTYLDSYTEVSRLIIAGGYTQPDPKNPNGTELTLFGATRTDPRSYYYRTATFPNDGDSSTAVWGAWQVLGIQINSDRVYPVRAFGRTFVFWTEVEQKKPDTQSSLTLQTKTKDDVQQVSGTNPVEYILSVKYSFLDLSGQWTTPQTLCSAPPESVAIKDTTLRASSVGVDVNESIVVDYQYDLDSPVSTLALPAPTRALLEVLMGLPPRNYAKSLTADLTVSDIQPVAVVDTRPNMLRSLFDPSESIKLDQDSVIVLGSADRNDDTPWYSFDIKGGSFLARPLEASKPTAPVPGLIPLAKNAEGLPEWTYVDACLDSSDHHQYLFNDLRLVYCAKGDVSEHRIDERWGLRRTKVLEDGQVDAAWKRGGVQFLARGDTYLKYSEGIEWADDAGDLSSEADRQRDGVPSGPITAAFTDKANKTWFFQGTKFLCLDAENKFSPAADIKDHWGLERNEFATGGHEIVAAFNRDERSFLISPSFYTWYTGADLMLCETPRPQSLRAVLVALNCSNSNDVDAGAAIEGAVDNGTELLFKVRRGGNHEVYSFKNNTVSLVKPAPGAAPLEDIAAFLQGDKRFAFTSTPGKSGFTLTVSGSTDKRECAQEIQAALLAGDGNLYLFGKDRYVCVTPGDISLAGIGTAVDQWSKGSAPIAGRWDRTGNVFTHGGAVTAALVSGNYTFLVSGDSYVRYSGTEYQLVDPGYPMKLAGNPDHLPEVPFTAAVDFPASHDFPHGRICYFEGTNHVFGDALTTQIPNRSRWGRIRTNILVRGVDTAYRVDNKHYLFSGNELACYTAGSDGNLPAYMDGAPISAELGSFGSVRGGFSYKGFLYLVGRDNFVCCTDAQPEQLLPEYPRNGQAGALVADLRARFHLPADVSDSMVEMYEVYALSLQGSLLYLDTDDHTPGLRVLQLNLSTGQLARYFGPPHINWAQLRSAATLSVDVGKVHYYFQADKVMKLDQILKTDKEITAAWDSGKNVRSITAVWGGRPFDAAIPIGDDLYFFVGDRYCTLPRAAATDNSGGSVVVGNLRNALTHLTPIRGSLTHLPAELQDGFDSAFPVDDSLYVFKGDKFAHYVSGGSKPQPVASLKYNITRLTTSTAAWLNRELFTGGVPQLLSLRTQEIAETPGFSVSSSSPTIIRVNPAVVNADDLPLADHLDFGSANGVYLWEIFFHVPFLIAEMLSTAQQFDEANTWFEYIFDPTEPADTWQFLPFLTVDVERIVIEFRDRLDQLDKKGVNTADLRATSIGLKTGPITLVDLLDKLLAMEAAFDGERVLSTAELDLLGGIEQLTQVRQKLDALALHGDPALETLRTDLRELVGLIEGLQSSWDRMQTVPAQYEAYLDDPFDPHAIAALRPIAYRRAIVMRYLDNLLDWGDMLFTQYTRESITEASMLYVEAWDVLGRNPESLGRRILPADCVYDALGPAHHGEYDMLLQLKESRKAELSFAAFLKQTPNEPAAQPYFFIPPNDELEQYWTRVADRLFKIRHSQNILGVMVPLALFSPPINPMDLVAAVAGAGGLAGLADAGAGLDVPHYRFSFLMEQAQSLVQTLAQLGSELLGALEKRDAEALNRLLTTQAGVILALTKDMQNSQLEEAKSNLQSLQQAKASAQKRLDVYSAWVNGDFLPIEEAQIGLLAAAGAFNVVAAALNLAGAILTPEGDATVGLFTTGDTFEFSQALMNFGQASSSLAGVMSGIADILGITAQHERSMADWTLQRDLATIDLVQIQAQIDGANWQIQAAQQQIAMTQRQIAQNDAVSSFYRSKFTNQELYDWMAGQLSNLHYQTYQLALGMARAAEQSFQFERGTGPSQTSFILGQPWDSQRKGLLSGYTLGLALNRMQAAFIATDSRRFEITKSISLVALDPMAFIKLKTDGACEFDLGEALFDYDFPGHYCRQITTIAVDLALGDGVLANATLTQLTNRVIMEADPKAVSYLLDPKETPPATIRTNWKSQQQIALSYHTQYETNSGVFNLAFGDQRYLPFEGTGAVSHWRLELGGPPGSYDLRNLTDVTITLKYTALQGGDAFAASVRGLLKPTNLLRCFNLSVDFANAWTAFLQGDSDVLELPLTPSNFPNMVSGQISAIFTHYEYAPPATGGASFIIDKGQPLPLPEGKTVDTSGLTVRAAGTTLVLRLPGDKSTLTNAYLVMGYKGGVR